MIYSSSYVWAEYKFNDPYKFVKTQSLFLIVGFIIMYITLKIPYTKYLAKSNIIFIICIILLILVLIPGIGTVRNGSRSWFGIGPLGIQPSEFAKLGLIIYTSKYLSHNNKNIKYILIIPHAMSRTKNVHILESQKKEWLKKKKKAETTTRYSRLPGKFATETLTSEAQTIVLYH